MPTPRRSLSLAVLATAALALSACQARSAAERVERARVEQGMKQLLLERTHEWNVASRALADAAPLPAGRGWSTLDDAAALERMRSAWHRGRTAYELIEGAIAPLFPESDTATDARYDDYLAHLAPDGDPDAFDDRGVIGMHALERILWADQMPPEVSSFERGLPGYRAARMPESEAETRAFKEKLAARLVHDVDKLHTELSSVELDVAFAFRGLIDLAAEQVEKVDRAATGQEESRYARATLKDLRANHQGCLDAYRLFEPWLQKQSGGSALNQSVHAAFDRLGTLYASYTGDALPPPPNGWSGLKPSAEHAATPFGRLFDGVRRESDETLPGSLRAELMRVSHALSLPEVVRR